VDEIVFSQPKILEACVIGVPDAYSGERIKPFVVLKSGMKVTADETIAYCKDNLVKYKVPKYVKSVDDLPKGAIGKILQKETRRMALVKGEKSGER
jgi:long-chain acyl-CoA synthetase